MNLYSRILAEGREEERSLVAVERHNSHALVTLNDPERLNSLTPAIVVQLQDALAELAARSPAPGSDPHRPRPSLFSSGDLELIESAATKIQNAAQAADATDAWRWIRRQFGGVVRTIASTDKAFVAAINGPAAGVGLAFALACDLIIASEKAVLVPAFGRLGLVPEVGVRGKHLEAEESRSTPKPIAFRARRCPRPPPRSRPPADDSGSHRCRGCSGQAVKTVSSAWRTGSNRQAPRADQVERESNWLERHLSPAR